MVTRAELKRIPMLVGLPEDELGRIAQVLSLRTLAEGEFACRADERSTQLTFLLEGRVRVSVFSDDGRELSLALLSGGEVFGEIAMLTGSPRTADVIALSNCTLLTLSREDFFGLLHKCPGFSLHMMKTLAERLFSTSCKLADLVFLDLQTRVLKTIWQIASPANKGGGQMLIDSFLSRKDLATLVGGSREAVSRALHSLEEQGHLDLSDGRIRLVCSEPLWN